MTASAPSVRRDPRELECRLVGLGAAVREPNAARERCTRQPRCELERRDVAVQVRDMPQGRELIAQNVGKIGPAVAESRDCESGREVEVLASFGVPHERALATHENEPGMSDDPREGPRLVRRHTCFSHDRLPLWDCSPPALPSGRPPKFAPDDTRVPRTSFSGSPLKPPI